MQSRTRLAAEGGGIEEYLKPRVTTDASVGGIMAVNAGVRAEDRGVQLPTAQNLARAWAIADSACGPHPRATSAPRVDIARNGWASFAK